MPLATTRRSGLVDQVIEQMRAEISTGEWPVGERIPPEPELVSVLGVGRNTVREAVRALSHTGLLEVRQGDGTFVRATSELSGALRRMCGSELREVLEVRRVIEVEGARLAASRRTKAELTAMTRSLARRDKAAGAKDIEAFVATDAEFHRHVIAASHNKLLVELYRGLDETIEASVAETAGQDIRNAHMVSHQAILDAIAEGAPDAAATAAAEFLDELLRRHSPS